MSMAGEIRAIVAERETWTTKEIGKIVGCSPEYVRVVARQRITASGRSAIDDRYYQKFVEEHGCSPDTHRYRTDPTYRAHRLSYFRKWHRARIANNPVYRERRRASNRAWAARQREALALA